jgi:hypothetical protein
LIKETLVTAGLIVFMLSPMMGKSDSYTNEQLITGLARATKANDGEAIDTFGKILDGQSHACAVRIGTLARFIGAGSSPQETLVSDYASASAEICSVGPSVIFYYIESIQDLMSRSTE